MELEVKENGNIRSIDELGRLVLPAELRQKMNLEPKGKVAIDFTEDNKIILSKAE